MADEQLTIGELANRTGVATSALRYWEQLGLFPAPTRVSGQRRYPPSAVGLVGEILLLRDVGFTLRDIHVLIASRSSAGSDWRELPQRKLTELDQRIAQAQAARAAIAHALACPHEDIHDCPNFAGAVAARLSGASLAEALPVQADPRLDQAAHPGPAGRRPVDLASHRGGHPTTPGPQPHQ